MGENGHIYESPVDTGVGNDEAGKSQERTRAPGGKEKGFGDDLVKKMQVLMFKGDREGLQKLVDELPSTDHESAGVGVPLNSTLCPIEGEREGNVNRSLGTRLKEPMGGLKEKSTEGITAKPTDSTDVSTAVLSAEDENEADKEAATQTKSPDTDDAHEKNDKEVTK